jgi:GntR family transcriptional regulator, transcriptional repressor for pyruvate dehydrogenase complex
MNEKMVLKIKKLNVRPAYQVISDELTRQIVEGSLSPGDILPSETELADRFGVNRSTVREGIRQLHSEGLLRREDSKRLVVSLPNYATMAPRTTRAMLMHQVTFEELWEIAMALEPLSAALAGARIDPDALNLLRENLKRTEEAVAAGISPVKLDTEFHRLVAEIAGNHALLLAREPVGLLLYPAYAAMRPSVPQSDMRLIVAHTRIVGAIANRDAEEARIWMRKHIADFRRGWVLADLKLDMPIAPTSTEA